MYSNELKSLFFAFYVITMLKLYDYLLVSHWSQTFGAYVDVDKIVGILLLKKEKPQMVTEITWNRQNYQ